MKSLKLIIALVFSAFVSMAAVAATVTVVTNEMVTIEVIAGATNQQVLATCRVEVVGVNSAYYSLIGCLATTTNAITSPTIVKNGVVFLASSLPTQEGWGIYSASVGNVLSGTNELQIKGVMASTLKVGDEFDVKVTPSQNFYPTGSSAGTNIVASPNYEIILSHVLAVAPPQPMLLGVHLGGGKIFFSATRLVPSIVYQIQTSRDLLQWNNFGEKFTADRETMDFEFANLTEQKIFYRISTDL